MSIACKSHLKTYNYQSQVLCSLRRIENSGQIKVGLKIVARLSVKQNFI